MKCKRCTKKLTKYSEISGDLLCDDCYEEDIYQDRQTFLGDDEFDEIDQDAREHVKDTKNILKHIIKYILVGLLTVCGLILYFVK